MAYSTSNPPKLIAPSFTNVSGESSIWMYSSTDAGSAVDASGYITNAKSLGMKVGDIVIVRDSDASPVAVTSHNVVAVNSDGSGDLSDGVVLSSTNSD